jgi:hypothetical protein
MAQVQMQVYRGTSDYLDTISNVDGQFLYDEDTHQILLDNGTTREQYGGGNEKVYDTYAEAVADLANIAEGQTVFVKEGTNSDKPTITYAEWQQLSDIEKEAFSGYVSNFPEEQLNASAITYGNTNVGAELTSINTHLSYTNPTRSFVGDNVTTLTQMVDRLTSGLALTPHSVITIGNGTSFDLVLRVSDLVAKEFSDVARYNNGIKVEIVSPTYSYRMAGMVGGSISISDNTSSATSQNYTYSIYV